jgi:hypothetical protein
MKALIGLVVVIILSLIVFIDLYRQEVPEE